MTAEVEPLEVPRFSLAERDRRWARVRQAMEREHLDVIVAPPHTGHHDHFSANARYLAGLGGFSLEVGAVFPLESEVTAVTVPDVSPAHWRGRQDWVQDVRSQGREFGDCIAGRLHELNLGHGRVGIAGMAHIARFPDGLISHTMYEKIAAACPGSEIVDATLLLERVRSVKSEEEVGFLRQGVALAEAAIEVMAREARPGVPQCVVYGRMVGAMLERGGEIPTMIMWNVGPPGWAAMGPLPTRRELSAGDVLSAEVEGRWAGYVGQVTTMAHLGKLPAQYREMEDIALQALARCWDALKPGATLGDLARLTEQAAKDTAYNGRLIMHGRGLGDDAPLFTPSSGDDTGWVFEENQVFMVKPQISTDGRRLSVTLGDSVVCTLSGARRLGSRPVKVIELL
ncbi:MAG TPA: M24 family metallopeptidase [Chloroflexota bacterium]